MKEEVYNRKSAVKYAKQWAFKRNPNYYNFDTIGGDCTNFVSQCIYAGTKTMNYTKDFGWYYINANNKAPSWSGVEYLYNFLKNNKKVGPYGKECKIEELEIGDIVQLSFDGNIFSHTLLIVKINDLDTLDGIKISSHTLDAYEKSLSEYIYEKIRFIHIKGNRIW